MVVGVLTDPVTLEPHQATDLVATAVVANVCETLVQFWPPRHGRPGRPTPWTPTISSPPCSTRAPSGPRTGAATEARPWTASSSGPAWRATSRHVSPPAGRPRPSSRRTCPGCPCTTAPSSPPISELFLQAEEGRVDLAELTRPPLPRAGGGGVLQRLGGNVSLTWRDLAVLMVGWSDNEAANLLAGKLGMEAVNRRLDTVGLTRTRLRRRMMDLAAAREGRRTSRRPESSPVSSRRWLGARGCQAPARPTCVPWPRSRRATPPSGRPCPTA